MSRSWVWWLPKTQPAPWRLRITARGRGMPWGRRMRTDTWPEGPPGTVVSSMSTVSFLTGPDWTASTFLRPWSGPSSNKNGGSALASATALACGSRSTGLGMTASSGRRRPDRAWTAPPPRAATDEHQHEPADRHPRQASDSTRRRAAHRGSGSTRLVLQGGAAGAVGVALPRRPATRSGVTQPSCVHSTRSPPLVCGLRGQLRCSASRPPAVVVPLPGQLPRHGKPGVGLGDLQLSAPQVLLDVDVGPALLAIDLVVERLATGQRLVPSLHGVVPGQLPPLRHGSPPSPGPSGPSRPERQLLR